MTPAAWAPLLHTARTQRRLVARLVARFGTQHLALAEEAVQTAVLRALERWPTDGLPAQPEAWLYRVAQHALIDQLRREARRLPLDSEPADTAEDPSAADHAAAPASEPEGPPAHHPSAWTTAAAEPRFAGDIDDEEMSLLLACCHPSLPPATQVALALRTLAALPLADVASALLSNEAAVAQRLARARRTLAETSLALPTGEALAERRDTALTVLSLLFLAGQQHEAATAGTSVAVDNGNSSANSANSAAGDSSSTSGNSANPAGAAPPGPRAAAWEAIRLARALALHPVTAHPDADALAATLLLHGARLTGRLDAQGAIVPLPGQPRDRWDRGMLRLGLHHLQRARQAQRLSRWHLLAGIAAEHATAPTYAQTRWSAIVGYYAALQRLDTSAAPGLGHAIALVEAGEVDAGRARLLALGDSVPPALQAHRWAALAQADAQQGRWAEARHYLDLAVAAAPRQADARLLARRLGEWGG